MEQEQLVLKDVASAVTHESMDLVVTIIPCNAIHALLQNWGLLPTKRVLAVRPVTLGTLIRISKLMLTIDTAALEKGNVLDGNYQLIEQHGKTVAGVIALAIHNNREKPSPRLVRFILTNFTAKELLAAMATVLRQMNVQTFMTTIISVRGMNVLAKGETPEVSPMEQGS